jgi:putative chitinase
MSITYANRSGNGSAESHDGYTYRGRGAVHLTFREGYREVSKVANKLFAANFNWEVNYEQLENSKQDIIYSGVAFFLWKLNYDLSYLQNNNCTSVSKKVNGGDNGLDQRKAAVNKLIDSDLFDCAIPKEEIKKK